MIRQNSILPVRINNLIMLPTFRLCYSLIVSRPAASCVPQKAKYRKRYFFSVTFFFFTLFKMLYFIYFAVTTIIMVRITEGVGR